MKRSIKLFSYIYIIGIGLFCVYTCVSHKIVIGGTDGINQHYRSMVYISNLYRSFIPSLLSGQNVLPMYDISIGMGDDILTTLNYYGLGDPFYLLTILANHNTMPYFFTVLFYFRLYLAGIAMILFGARLLPGRKNESYVVAAFVYCFSGFALEANCHIIFVHAMMYLPLVLWAIIGCYKRIQYSPIILSISVMLLACTNIYFLYIISIVACIYALCLLLVYKDRRTKIISVGFSYLTGLLCAAVVLIPVSISILESNRRQVVDAKAYIRLFYSFEEYRRLFYRLFYVTDEARGMAAVPIIGFICLLLVLAKKNNKRLIYWIVIGGVCYCLPVVSWIMSGMGGNVYGRWEIVLTIITSLCVIDAWDDLINIQKRQLLIIWITALLLVLIGILDHTVLERCYRNTLLGYFGFAVVLSCTATHVVQFQKLVRYAITGLAVACTFLTWITNVINYNIDSIRNDSDEINKIKSAEDESFYRIDSIKAYIIEDNMLNLSMINDYSTTTEYFSIDNPGYIDGRYKIGLGDSYLITGFDNRSILQSLASVKYILSENHQEYRPPYGFIHDEILSHYDAVVYKNEYAFPLIYTYSKTIPEEEFSKLNPIEKQISMTEYITYGNEYRDIKENVDEYIGDNESAIGLTSESIDDGYTNYLTCICKNNKETYLYIDDYQFKGRIIINGYIKSVFGNEVNYINLGYYDKDTEVTVQFDSDKIIDLKDINLKELDVIPVFEKNIARLKENGIDNDIIKKNTISSVVESEKDAYVCLSIPYSKGWSAYMDGKSVETFVANELFIGFKMPSGKHDIEFRYETPGIRIGFFITVCSIICLLIICIIERKKYDQKDASVC